MEDYLQNQLRILAPSAIFEPDFRLLVLYCAKLNWRTPNFPVYLDAWLSQIRLEGNEQEKPICI